MLGVAQQLDNQLQEQMICMDAERISAFAEPVTKLTKHYFLFGQFSFLLRLRAELGSARVDK